MDALSFRRWFAWRASLDGCTDLALRRRLVDELAKIGARTTERTIRSIAEEKHEPRRDLRAALMQVTGLPVTAFVLGARSAA